MDLSPSGIPSQYWKACHTSSNVGIYSAKQFFTIQFIHT